LDQIVTETLKSSSLKVVVEPDPFEEGKPIPTTAPVRTRTSDSRLTIVTTLSILFKQPDRRGDLQSTSFGLNDPATKSSRLRVPGRSDSLHRQLNRWL
jgi:hypothetical protein